ATDEVDLDAAMYSRKRRVLTLAAYQTDKPRRHYFDDQTQSLYRQLESLLPGYDVALQGWNRDEDTYIVAAYNDRTPGSRYLCRACSDDAAQSLSRRRERLLPAYDVALQGWNRDEATYVVAAYTDRTPRSRYLFRAGTGALHGLAEINPAIPEADMSPVRPVRYTSRDGLEIHGYLTLPAGRPARGLPCIVNPHGGPRSDERRVGER